MITVVGAGIVGAACARALVRGGAAVRVIDARAPGTGASAEGMGHVLALDHDPPTLALSHRSLELWHALAPALPQSAEWSGAGTLWLARTPDELEHAWDEAEDLRNLGLTVERLDNDAARALEPCLSPALAGALRVADDRVVYPPVVAAWMLAQAREAGAEVITGVGVRSLEPANQGERVVLDDGRALECEAVVLATALGTGALLPADSPLRAAIRPRRGHLIITERLPTTGAPALAPLARLRHQLVELGYHDSVATRGATSVAFNLQPRSTGQLLLGSSRQDMDPSLPLAALKAIDADTLGRMVARAQPFVPALGQARALRSWVGLRPATEDGLPLIGPLPGRPRVVLAAGHEGLGITTSVATAELVAAALGRGHSALDPRPYLPERLLREASDAA